MAYQVLARKWRPKHFADLVGQEHVVGALRNALAQGRLHHAYLLTGTRGVGKTTIARILAKSLNCEHPDQGEPCGVCAQCVQIDTGRHVDVVEIDAASNTGIDNIREVLENAQYAPSMGRYKVYIIDEVHMLSKSAFNAMLKTLEEPPEHVKFILATTDPQKVPVTVLSRCLQFVLRNMTPQQVLGHLQYVLGQEHIAFETVGLDLLARAANGSMRDALSLLDQAIALGSGQVQEATVRQMLGAVDRQFVYRLLETLAAGDAQALMQQVRQILAEGAGFGQVLQELALVLQQLALVQMLPSAADELADAHTLQALAQRLSAEQIQLFYQCAIHGKNDLPLAPDEQAGVMMTMLRMLALRPLGVAEVSANQQVVLPESVHVSVSEQSSMPAAPQVAPTPNSDNASIQAVETAEMRPVNTQVVAEASLQAAVETPAQVDRAATAASAVVETSADEPPEYDEHDLPPWDDSLAHYPADVAHDMDVFEPETAIADVAAHEVIAAPVVDASESEAKKPETVETTEAAVDVPALALNADNWPHIVQHIAPQLSAARMLAQHAAFAGFDAVSGELHLEITHEGKVIEDRHYLNKLSDTLSAYTGRPVHVTVQDWQGEMETPHAQAVRHEEERREQGLQILQQDEVAQQLTSLFEGTWVPESVHLKSPSA
ncbi:DNA polymerase III subunit gamma/tau [Vitreoscilla massiliensis]|uniref:DNA polymerase III subunit gamma/tau n=1 Tax=Vitreoscilla massiliensis TaxID=1689272 RepID=A0ABY4E1Z1_9NEIS|nr:DNA polymerase III subunit gamma/tau [Vitreoscilla massiliensis]UOO89800.1 DNA polymerase III subunit gamma/tau [Vitreoscilla massiliensis]